MSRDSFVDSRKFIRLQTGISLVEERDGLFKKCFGHMRALGEHKALYIPHRLHSDSRQIKSFNFVYY